MSMSLDRSTTLKPEKPFRCDIPSFSQRMAIEGFISLWIPTHFGKQDEFYENSKIDTSHCHSYTEINIRKHEFGAENLWRCLAPKNGKSGNTIKRMSFVLSFDTKLSNKGFLMVRDALDFLFFSMKKWEKNPVGILLLD